MAVLITGAGTGFGFEVALRLAKQGLDAIAGMEIVAQVHVLEQEARKRGVKRAELVQKAYDIEPGTSVKSEVLDKEARNARAP
ncbi:hypothetical protein ICJ33_16565 [Pseudomonas simiae]|uniref:hypothetical protein n=1 Tax=Pseudomonas simiae TaxID=321846 RepID=UPI0018E344A9|nr:hypothetical protein [Pseudomonas simiae]QQD25922.1 hypothetical protein ICJ33_16565 [Pseudomonas simiae]